MNNDLQNSQSVTKPTREEITSRAEVLWKAKGAPSGRDEEIWLEAEKQLADEAREVIGTTPRSQLSSEEPAMPADAIKSARAAEQMSNPAKTGGGSRRRSSGR